ncbi:MAG: hypothetical protein SH820_01915 [Xanthomonadales bacterium]|nr:hypothetical protein [Xanthomonadales bacterium]
MSELSTRPLWGNQKSLPLPLLMALTLLLSACASSGKVQHNPVEERAQQRWDALLSRDFDTAYSLYSPGYRSANSRVDFEISQRIRKVTILVAQVNGSECSAQACTVNATVQYRVGSPVPGVSKWESSSKLQERWVKTDGKWWYVPDK